MEPNAVSGVPQNVDAQKASLDRQIALMSVLREYGLITEEDDVDLEGLVLKKEDLKVAHTMLSNEAAIALAYLDTNVAKAKEEGVSIDDIVDSLPRGLVASLVGNPVARNDGEFIKTIFANLKLAMAEGSEDFSSVLLSVIQARLASYLNVVSGVIDKDGVVTTDETRRADKEAESGEVILH